MIVEVLKAALAVVVLCFAFAECVGLWPTDLATQSLFKAIEMTSQALFAGILASQSWAQHTVGGAVGGSIFTLLAGISAWVAFHHWNNWRRRRRKRPRRASGRVAVRLGRLVIVPR